MKIKDFLNKDNWIKGHNARDRHGNPVGSESEEACCWCLLGAIVKCYEPHDRGNIQNIIQSHLPSGQDLISLFNDSTTWEQVEEVVRKANV